MPLLIRGLARTDFSHGGLAFLKEQLSADAGAAAGAAAGAVDYVREVQLVFMTQATYNLELHSESVEFGAAGADALHKTLSAASAQARRVFGQHVDVPNMHAREHQPAQRLDLGPNVCTLGNRFESVHALHKSVCCQRCQPVLIHSHRSHFCCCCCCCCCSAGSN
jgi:hypothetical protein